MAEPCGCEYDLNPLTIRYCPMHAAAGEMLAALEVAHDEAVAAEECWRVGCMRDQNHGALRSNRNVAVRVATYNALAAARSGAPRPDVQARGGGA